MPEGHTIHRLARDIARDLRNHPVRARSRQARFTDGAQRLDGRMLERTSANGKHLFLHFADPPAPGDEILHVHLGLFGKFRRSTHPAPEPSDALRLRLSGVDSAWDLTGPITCDLRSPDILDEVAAKLGPDPLRRDADPHRFVERVLGSRQAIGALLMDQRVIAGVGNVYRAEILHLTCVHPEREGRSLTEAEAKAIWDVTVDQLRLGLKRNRIVTVPLAGRAVSRIPTAETVHVYKQRLCRTCGAEVEWTEIANRNSFACASCQPR